MNHKEIENKYRATMAQILAERLESEAKAHNLLCSRKKEIAKGLTAHYNAIRLRQQTLNRELASEKLTLMEKKANGTPTEVLEAEKRFALKKCEYENAKLTLANDRVMYQAKVASLKDDNFSEYQATLNRIRHEANAKIAIAKDLFKMECDAYSQWRQQQEIKE